MSTADLYVKINSMPEHLRKELIDFMEFLLQRNERGREEPAKEPAAGKARKRIAGLMKGQIHMADDFDAPLDDFKEYME